MLYDVLIPYLDAIPTLSFLAWFMIIYLLLHPVVHNILLKSQKYSSFPYERQSYILCNVMEVTVLIGLTYICLASLWRDEINLIDVIDTVSLKHTTQAIINIGTMYAMKDVAELFVNKKIGKSTIVHHCCVIMAYLYTLRVLTTDFNTEGIFKCFIAYAIKSTLDFPYKLHLALRFFIDKNGSFNKIFNRYVFYHNFLCMCINFSWQTFYFFNLITTLYSDGTSLLKLLISGMVYLVLMAGWLNEEYVLMGHLSKF